MSLLTVVQQVSRRLGLPSPSSVAGSQDVQSLQLMELLNEDGQELAARSDWQALRNEATFTTVATQSQGAITTLAGSGLRSIIGETIWNRTQRRPVYGARSPQEWQQLQAQTLQGPFVQFIIRGGLLLFVPVPSAGQTCAFEWMSSYWVNLAAGGTSDSAAADGDTFLLPERLLRLGVIWRFKQAKGLDYAEDFNKAEAAIQDAMARDSVPARLSLSGMPPDYYPAVLVPAGNWGS